MEYYNKYKDEYIIIANDVHINPFESGYMPIPHPHKDIPIVCYTDHQVDATSMDEVNMILQKES